MLDLCFVSCILVWFEVVCFALLAVFDWFCCFCTLSGIVVGFWIVFMFDLLVLFCCLVVSLMIGLRCDCGLCVVGLWFTVAVWVCGWGSLLLRFVIGV